MQKVDKRAFSVRLRSLRIRKGLTQQRLADKAGVTRASITNWESLKTFKITSMKHLSNIANILQVDPLFLMFGEDSKHYNGYSTTENNDVVYFGNIFKIPVLNFKDIKGDENMLNIIKYASEFKVTDAQNDKCFILIVDDNSMVDPNPEAEISFPPGHRIAVDPVIDKENPLKHLVDGKFAYVMIGKNDPVFRKVVRNKKEKKVILKALNPAAPDYDFEPESGDMLLGIVYEKSIRI